MHFDILPNKKWKLCGISSDIFIPFRFLFVFFLCLFFVAQAGLPACLPLVGLDGSPPHCSTLLCCICLILYFFVYLHFFLVGVICLMYLLGCDGWRLHCSALCSTLLCSPTQLSPTVLLFQPQERSVR